METGRQHAAGPATGVMPPERRRRGVTGGAVVSDVAAVAGVRPCRSVKKVKVLPPGWTTHYSGVCRSVVAAGDPIDLLRGRPGTRRAQTPGGQSEPSHNRRRRLRTARADSAGRTPVALRPVSCVDTGCAAHSQEHLSHNPRPAVCRGSRQGLSEPATFRPGGHAVAASNRGGERVQ